MRSHIYNIEVSAFVRGYVAAMLWSSTDEDDEPLDWNYGPENLDEEARERIDVECRAFLYRVGYLITEENYEGTRDPSSLSEYAGHDFWLTRNGHGAGFWDGGWRDYAGEQLTKVAESFGELSPAVQDDTTVGFDG